MKAGTLSPCLPWLMALSSMASMPGQSLADQPLFTQTYDIPTMPCHGLELDGVRYFFTVASLPNPDCLAGTFIGPGITQNIQELNIEGTSAGILSLEFAVPTTRFGFGVAELAFSPQPSSVIVELHRAGASRLRQKLTLDTSNDPEYAGGRYDYQGPAVTKVSIRFSGEFARFAVDNLSYFRPKGRHKTR